MTSVYRLHPSSINKNIIQYPVCIPWATHQSLPLTADLGNRALGALHGFLQNTFWTKKTWWKPLQAEFYKPRYFSFLTQFQFAIVHLCWLGQSGCTTQMTGLITLLRKHTLRHEKRRFLNVGRMQTSSGTSPNIAPYLFILQKPGHWCWFCATRACLHTMTVF